MNKIYSSILLLSLFIISVGNLNAQFTESFDASIPASWTVIDNDGQTYTWVHYTDYPYQGAGGLRIHWETNAHDDYLITPQFTVAASTSDRVKFFAGGTGPTYPETFDVKLSTTGTNPGDFTVTLGSGTTQVDAEDGVYEEFSYDIPATYQGQDVYIAVIATSTNEFYLYLDEFSIEGIPACPDPTNLTASNIDATSADLGWTDNSTGSATGFEIELGTAGFTPTGTATNTSPTSPFNASSLTPSTDYEFYVRSDCGSGDFGNWVGPFSFTTLATCPEPTALGVSNVNMTEAQLGWTDNAGASLWDIEIGNAGFTPTGSPTNTGVSNPFNASGLNPNTDYEYYVRADCGSGDFSNWVGPFSFTTTNQTPVSSYPYNQDWETGEGNWEFTNGSTNQWIVGSGISNSGSQSLYISDNGTDYSYDINSASVSHAYRDFQIPAGNPYIELSFDWTCDGETFFGAPFDFLTVYIAPTSYTPTSGTAITTGGTAPSGIIQLNGEFLLETSYINEFFELDQSYDGQSFRLIFQWENDGSDGSEIPASIDNVSVDIQSCLVPTNLTAVNINQNDIELSWTENGTASDWEIEYGPIGFTPGTGNVVSSNTNPYTVNSLNAATGYDFYVSSNCNDGSFSQQPTPLTLFTEGTCGVYTLSLEDSYNDGWNGNRISLYVNGNLFTDTTLTNGSGPLDIQIPVNIDDIISIEYENNNGSINTYPGENEYSLLDETNTVIVNEGTGTNIPGNLGNPLVPNGIQACTTCPAPNSLVFEYTSQDTASVEWVAGGVETNWNIVYGPQGFIPGSGNGTLIATTSTTDTAFNLQGGIVYDFYVQADCGGSGSMYVGPISYAAPITNDEACDAIQVPVNGSTTSYINDGASLQTDEPTNLGDNTVWFTFDAPASGQVEINTCGEDFDNFIKVFEATDCSDFTSFVGVDSATNNPFVSCSGIDPAGLNLCGLTPGNTYYLAVGSETAGNTGTFPLTLTAIPNADAGTGSTSEVCSGDMVTLSGAISGNDNGGVWSEIDMTGGLESNGVYNTSNLAYTDFEVEYRVTNECSYDSTIVTISISGPSQAGQDGSVTDCNVDRTIFLTDALSGTIDLGGTWNDVDGTGKLNGSVFTPDSLAAGMYTFEYVVSNGVCPNDTSIVEVTLTDCLGTEDVNAESFKIFPNPTNGIFYLVSAVNANNAVVEITDLQGKVVSSEQMNLNIGSQYDFNLSQLERGVYLIRVATEDNSTVKRVVLQR